MKKITRDCHQMIIFIAAAMVTHAVAVSSTDLIPYLDEIGGTLCAYLASKSQIPKNYLSKCEKPTCHWDSWQDARMTKKNKEKVRYVVSLGHNGFGNQLWQHTTAFMVAESLEARLYIAPAPDALSPDGATAPNSFFGQSAIERLLPPQFLYSTLPANSSIRQLCDAEEFILADRPKDWRNGTYTTQFKQNLIDLMTDKKPRCVKMLGYFQNLPLCSDDAKQLWTPKMFSNYTNKPGPNDISIYLRCIPRHYFFNDMNYYAMILNNTVYDRIWLFEAPECGDKLSPDPSKDGLVASVMRLLITKYNATRWPTYNGTDDTSILLHDLSGLAQSSKLILPVSSWAQWAGLLSNATEIHVNYLPRHPVMPTMPQYIYHDEAKKNFFGRYNAKTNDVDFEFLWDKVKNTYTRINPNTGAITPVIPPKDLGSTNSTVKIEPDHSKTESETNSTLKPTAQITTLAPISKVAPNIITTKEENANTSHITTHTSDKLAPHNTSVGAWWWHEMNNV